MKRVQPIILAGGQGTRMNNPEVPKPLVPLKGRPIISYLLDTIESDGFMPPALVVGYRHEKVRETFGAARYTYIYQAEQLGTGHAVAICEAELAGKADLYLVMNGDHPLWTIETMKRLVAEHETKGATVSMVTLTTDNEAFYNFGRIIRGADGKIEAIREVKDCTEEEKKIKEVNPALYCFDGDWLWSALKKINTENAQHEYYITDLLEIAVNEGEPMATVEASSWQETLGINTSEQLEEVEKWM